MASKASVSPQTAKVMDELYGDTAGAAAQTPLPASPSFNPPGVPQFGFNTPKKPSEIDAANDQIQQAESTLIDKKIAEFDEQMGRRIAGVEERLNQSIAQLVAQMAHLNESINRMHSAASPVAAAAPPQPAVPVVEPPGPVAAAVSMMPVATIDAADDEH